MNIDAGVVLTIAALLMIEVQLILLRSGPFARAALMLIWIAGIIWSIRRWKRHVAHMTRSEESYAAVCERQLAELRAMGPDPRTGKTPARLCTRPW